MPYLYSTVTHTIFKHRERDFPKFFIQFMNRGLGRGTRVQYFGALFLVVVESEREIKNAHYNTRARARKRGAMDARGRSWRYRAQLAQVEQKLGRTRRTLRSSCARSRRSCQLYTQLLGADGGEGAGGSVPASRTAPARGAGLAGGSRPDVSAWAFPVGAVCEFKSPDGQWYPVRSSGERGVSDRAFLWVWQEKTVRLVN